jgi:hypothetical protein
LPTVNGLLLWFLLFPRGLYGDLWFLRLADGDGSWVSPVTSGFSGGRAQNGDLWFFRGLYGDLLFVLRLYGDLWFLRAGGSAVTSGFSGALR